MRIFPAESEGAAGEFLSRGKVVMDMDGGFRQFLNQLKPMRIGKELSLETKPPAADCTARSGRQFKIKNAKFNNGQERTNVR